MRWRKPSRESALHAADTTLSAAPAQTAWCETREGFRNFRIDRIEALDVLTERFRDKPGKTLPDLLRQVEAGRRER